MKKLLLFLLLATSGLAQSVSALAGALVPGQVTPAAPSGGAATFSSITDTGLTQPRVIFVGTGGLLVDDADMTFATDTLTVTKGTFGGITHISNAIAAANSLTSVALSPLILATGTTGTALTFASATNIGTFSAAPSAPSYTSTVATGTAPFTVASTTLVTNLHAATADSATSSTTATNATNTAITDDTSTNATMYPTWVTANTGNLPQKVSSTSLTFNPSTGALTSTTFNLGTTTPGIISGASGAITATAAGSNQSITLTPSGTGQIVGPLGAVGTPAFTFLGRTTNGIYSPAANTVDMAINGAINSRFVSTHLLLGGLGTDGTGVLQFPAATTSAGGITFGTDAQIFRGAAGQTNFSDGTNLLLKILPPAGSYTANGQVTIRPAGASGGAYIGADSTGFRVQGSNASNVAIGSAGGGTALTIGVFDAGTSSTFAFAGTGAASSTITGATFAGGVGIAGAGYFGGAVLSTSPTGGIGYATGAGGTVTQATDKTTGVTLSKTTGQITMNAASLAAGTSVGFTVTNTAVATTDVIIVNIDSGATVNSYTVTVDTVSAGSFHVHLRNESAGALAEAVVLTFAVIKGVTS